jgi:monoamine oxidase
MHSKGFEIEIIEARVRIGGHSHTITSHMGQAEMGATWFKYIHVNSRKL